VPAVGPRQHRHAAGPPPSPPPSPPAGDEGPTRGPDRGGDHGPGYRTPLPPVPPPSPHGPPGARPGAPRDHPPGAPPGIPTGAPPGGPPVWASAAPTSRPRPGGLLPLRPLTVGDVLDGSFRVLRATFATVALVILVVQGPYQLLSSLVLFTTLPELLDPVAMERLVTEGSFEVDLAVRALAYGGGAMIVGLLVQVLVGGALAWVALRTDRGEDATVGAALRASFAVSGATMGGTVLVGFVGLGVLLTLATLVGVTFAIAVPLGVVLLLAAIPAAVILAAAFFGAFYLVLPIAVAEEQGPWRTFQRAIWVVRRRFWRVVGLMLLLVLVIAAVSLGFSLALGFLSGLAGSWRWVVEGVTATATAILTVPIAIFAALLLYLDARVRLEGYDLEVRARGLGPS
jgi:hypothetical protein